VEGKIDMKKIFLYKFIVCICLLTLFFLNDFFVMTVIAEELPLQSINYQESFEINDPLEVWVSNGSYELSKTLSTEKSSHGDKSLKIELTFGTATYVYLHLLQRLPCVGELSFSGDIFVGSMTGSSKMYFGTVFSLSPCPLSDRNVDLLDSSNTGVWVTTGLDLVEAADLIAEKKISSECGGAGVADCGHWLDKVCLYLHGKQGESITLYLDNVKFEGSVPNVDDYEEQVKNVWSEYLVRVQQEVNSMANHILDVPILSGEEELCDLYRAFAVSMQAKVNGSGYPTGEEFDKLSEYKVSYDALVSLSHISDDLVLFPWKPITNQKILPNTYPVPVNSGNELSIKACSGEFEPATFIIRAMNKDQQVSINVSDLVTDDGKKILAKNVDLKVVKCWYQAGIDRINYTENRYLVPELLLKDDSLVKVDEKSKKNYLRVKHDGIEEYVDISGSATVFPDNAIVEDSLILQPFNLFVNSNKQIWITVHVPITAEPGDYKGSIVVQGGAVKNMALNVTVLPFDLPESPLDISIYYRGRLYQLTIPPFHADLKTSTQYLLELENMRNHGVVNPNIYQTIYSNNEGELAGQVLNLRKQAGLSNENLFILGDGTGISSDVEALQSLKLTVSKWKTLAQPYGNQNIYFYGRDEAVGDILLSQKDAWDAVHTVGGKVFVACYKDAYAVIGDILDVAILSGSHNSDQVDAWHSKGKKVYIYNYPQAGIEDPLIYRANYGLSLWLNGYDGVMGYAYQTSFGNVWNDFDDPKLVYRDHNFTYPTSEGVIDTVQWEGFREGVDDLRYLAALLKINPDQKTFISQQLDLCNGDLDCLRSNIVSAINSQSLPLINPPNSLKILE